MIGQVISLFGATLILAAFGAQQAGRMKPGDATYLALNFVGSAILAYFAIEARSLGLSVLESAWAVISLWSLGKAFRPGSSSPR
jgi:hypothetical protein